MAVTHFEQPQVISPHDLYLADEAMRRLGMGQWAWREFRRKSGLETTRIGVKVYVKGSAILDAVDRLSASPAAV